MATVQELQSELDSTKDFVWRSLGFRKHLVGRKTVDKATMQCILRWPPETLAGSTDKALSAEWQRDLRDYVVAAVSKSNNSDQKYGFVVLSMILAAVIGQVVAVLLKWWLEHRHNRELMEQFRIFRGQV